MTKPSDAGDAEVVAILKRDKCPTPFHQVRTRCLGGIATPFPGASPIDTVKLLCGGEFREFDSLDTANELLCA